MQQNNQQSIPIKWILFDQAGVQTKSLFSGDSKHRVHNMIITNRQLRGIFDTPSYQLYVIGKINQAELIEDYIHSEKLLITADDYTSMLISTIKKNDGIQEILSDLQENYKLASLIEEGNEWANYKLDVPKFRKYFDKIITSADIGMKKSDYRFFEKSLEILGAEPLECLFIDDKEKNCNAAEFTGIASIVFKNAQQLRQDLKNYHILIK